METTCRLRRPPPHDHKPFPTKKRKIEEEEEEGGEKDNVEDAEETENEKNYDDERKEAVEEDHNDNNNNDNDNNDDDDDVREKETTVDVLSSLPCHLLERILSYLPTKSAVPTALLSRRWRYLWASSLHLDFDDADVPQCRSADFIRFVGLAIASRRYPHALHTFRLALHRNYSHRTVGRWLRDADLFDLASLRTLRLATSGYALPLHWPSSARLPSLETLDLVGLRFDPPLAAGFVSSACPRLRSCSLIRCRPFSRLDLNCPLLEELFLANFCCGKLQDLRITAGRLRRLSIKNAFDVNVRAKTTLAISAPGVESFRWHDVTPHEYRLASPTPALRPQVVSLPRMFRKFDRGGRPVNLREAFAD